MTSPELSPDVRQFITAHIDSAEQLETLLLLHRDADRTWSAQDVSQAIYTVPASATMRLEMLVGAGFLESTGGSDPRYRYAPAADELRSSVQKLAAAYQADRVAVTKLIFAKPADPATTFANAFRLRGKDS